MLKSRIKDNQNVRAYLRLECAHIVLCIHEGGVEDADVVTLLLQG